LGKPAENTRGIWIHGPAGCGKTSYIHSILEGAEVYWKPVNKWWDGYSAQKIVLIDDVDPGHSKLAHHFKLWLDRYQFPVEYKGGMKQIQPELVIITSQYSIGEVFTDQTTREAIERRCYQHEIRPTATGLLMGLREYIVKIPTLEKRLEKITQSQHGPTSRSQPVLPESVSPVPNSAVCTRSIQSIHIPFKKQALIDFYNVGSESK
jgi:GTPase SAR1 family protein